MKFSLPHYLGIHEACPPRFCKTAARLCNEAESRNRTEDELARQNGTACPQCESGRTFPAVGTYHDAKSAIAAASRWDGTGEPEGWHRHPRTGRRRPDGDPNKEYVNL